MQGTLNRHAPKLDFLVDFLRYGTLQDGWTGPTPTWKPAPGRLAGACHGRGNDTKGGTRHCGEKESIVVTGQYEPVPLEESERAVQTWDVRKNLRPFLQLTNLTAARYEEIPSVPMPGRGIVGGLELVFLRDQ